ncbi:ABC transporter transmembrane domain-containing protein [Sinomonas sp. B1-1]|uniref:ABC transporter transmembrane domain-containing protein n=1 Tax=Sinomonas sp. B1-1 TaxID=3141454 RepID=UPI003D27F23B
MSRPAPREQEPGLPRFAVAGRRGRLAALVGIGVAVALLSAGTARLVSLLSDGPDPAGAAVLVAGLVALVGATAGLRVLERGVAERLGQDYVHQIRKELIRGALGPGRGPSLGITIARTSNDLNSVRNWVTLGIAAAVSGVPLILVLTAALWAMSPALALAVMGPLLAAVLLLAALSRPTYERARALRKARGRLAGQVTDTVNASTAIRAAGGEERELGRIDRHGREVADAAVRRATLAGSLRASAMGAASTAAVAVAAVGAFAGLERGLVAAALTVVSMISGPVHDLGRIVEYRQSYRAARRSIAPALPRTAHRADPTDAILGPAPEGPCEVEISGLEVGGASVPTLCARPGETVLLDGLSHAGADELFEGLLGVSPTDGAVISLGGMDLGSTGPAARRRCLGYAARGLHLERGQLVRAVRYRHPDADDAQLADANHRAALGTTIARLPKGGLTVLRRGGEPLTVPERARVQLARAILGNPPLLLLNRIDADLDPHGLTALQSIIADYPGVVIIATDNPAVLPPAHQHWHPASNPEPVPVPQ